jgi:hypothetical protein
MGRHRKKRPLDEFGNEIVDKPKKPRRVRERFVSPLSTETLVLNTRNEHNDMESELDAMIADLMQLHAILRDDINKVRTIEDKWYEKETVPDTPVVSAPVRKKRITAKRTPIENLRLDRCDAALLHKISSDLKKYERHFSSEITKQLAKIDQCKKALYVSRGNLENIHQHARDESRIFLQHVFTNTQLVPSFGAPVQIIPNPFSMS